MAVFHSCPKLSYFTGLYLKDIVLHGHGNKNFRCVGNIKEPPGEPKTWETTLCLPPVVLQLDQYLERKSIQSPSTNKKSATINKS